MWPESVGDSDNPAGPSEDGGVRLERRDVLAPQKLECLCLGDRARTSCRVAERKAQVPGAVAGCSVELGQKLVDGAQPSLHGLQHHGSYRFQPPVIQRRVGDRAGDARYGDARQRSVQLIGPPSGHDPVRRPQPHAAHLPILAALRQDKNRLARRTVRSQFLQSDDVPSRHDCIGSAEQDSGVRPVASGRRVGASEQDAGGQTLPATVPDLGGHMGPGVPELVRPLDGEYARWKIEHACRVTAGSALPTICRRSVDCR